VLASPEAWENMVLECPGMGNGTMHDFAEIEAYLEKRRAQEIIARKQ
jgi:hypothetical protein